MAPSACLSSRKTVVCTVKERDVLGMMCCVMCFFALLNGCRSFFLLFCINLAAHNCPSERHVCVCLRVLLPSLALNCVRGLLVISAAPVAHGAHCVSASLDDEHNGWFQYSLLCAPTGTFFLLSHYTSLPSPR